MKSKLTEQVVERACLSHIFTAATTAEATSEAIDRKGFNTAFFVMSGKCFTAGGTFNVTAKLYQSADVATGVYTVVTSATISGTISTTFTWSFLPTSAATTSSAKAINLSGLNRFIKIYLTVTAAVTNNITCGVACILGDGQVEPAT
jgi:hypothetical protein